MYVNQCIYVVSHDNTFVQLTLVTKHLDHIVIDNGR